MTAVSDPAGVQWKVHRRWWPFDLSFIVDVDSITVTVVCALPFVIFWPFWFISKFLGVKWRIVLERSNTEVGTELVRGWRRSGDRINGIAADIAQGRQSVLS